MNYYSFYFQINFGFYTPLNSTTELTESSQKSSSTTAKASQLTSGGDMLLQAREDLGIKGSFAQSQNGNVTIKGKSVSIEAASQTMTQSSNDSVHQMTTTLASTAPTQVGSTSFKDNQAQSKTTQTTYLLSGVKAENGTVKIVSEGDILVAGAEIIGNNIEIAALKGNLTVKSLQDVLEYRQGSQGIQVGQTNGFSVSEATKSSLWVNTQTKIVGTNSVALKAGTLNNDGALIANITKDGIDGGNLSVIADQIIYNTLQDRNKESSYGISLGISGSATPPLQTPNGSTTIGASYSGLNQAQSTQATIGNGTIQTTSSLAGLNRDIGVTQKMTKDQKTGGLNVNLTIDNAVFANPVAYFAPIVELPQNVAGAAKNVAAEARIKAESTWDTITGKNMSAEHRAYRDSAIRQSPLNLNPDKGYFPDAPSLDQMLHPEKYRTASAPQIPSIASSGSLLLALLLYGQDPNATQGTLADAYIIQKEGSPHWQYFDDSGNQWGVWNANGSYPVGKVRWETNQSRADYKEVIFHMKNEDVAREALQDTKQKYPVGSLYAIPGKNCRSAAKSLYRKYQEITKEGK